MIINCALTSGVEIADGNYISRPIFICSLVLIFFFKVLTCVFKKWNVTSNFIIDDDFIFLNIFLDIFEKSVIIEILKFFIANREQLYAFQMYLILIAMFSIIPYCSYYFISYNIKANIIFLSLYALFYIVGYKCFIKSQKFVCNFLSFVPRKSSFDFKIVKLFIVSAVFALIVYFVIVVFMAHKYDTKVQFVCNFANNVIEIIGIRILTTDDFVEYYTYDTHDIKKVDKIQTGAITIKNDTHDIKKVDKIGKVDKIQTGAITIKICQLNGDVQIQFFKDGNEVESFDGIGVEIGFWGIMNAKVTPKKVENIQIFKDRSEYGSFTVSEISRWFFSSEIIDKNEREMVDKNEQEIVDNDEQKIVDNNERKIVDNDEQEIVYNNEQEIVDNE